MQRRCERIKLFISTRYWKCVLGKILNKICKRILSSASVKENLHCVFVVPLRSCKGTIIECYNRVLIYAEIYKICLCFKM